MGPERRGGPRRNWIFPSEAAVSVSSGRWGRRRVRDYECWVVLRVEDLYTGLLRSGLRLEPGGGVHIRATGGLPVEIEVVPNPIWRKGRLFFTCRGCRRRATRLYVPVEGVDPRCRRCWGLNYESQRWSYHGGFSAREICHITTDRERRARRRAARARYAERRGLQ
jgi:hypothetical protein